MRNNSMNMNVTILGYRVSGLDGVSLECVNWKNVLEKMGHQVTFVAGELDREGILLPELHFKSPKVAKIHDQVAYNNTDYKKVEHRIFLYAGRLEAKLRNHFRKYGKPDLLIVPNVLSLPMHFPLAVALARVIEELAIPTIARHHDFWWERERYNKSHMFEFWKRWFPPKAPHLYHTVINSIAKDELKKRTGIKAKVIWDSFDFSKPRQEMDSFAAHFRNDFGITQNDFVFLQATRIIPRKRIELSIEIISQLNDPRAVLIIAGHEGDEAPGYLDYLKALAKEKQSRILFIGDRIDSQREMKGKRRTYTLWDCYINCDAITYPTAIEGFGNQLVEAIFYKKPVIMTPYPVFERDIQPLGFETILMKDHVVTEEVLSQVRQIMNNPEKIKPMVEKNFELGKKYMSYEWVEEKLQQFFKEMKLK
jgi:mannosylglucosylglycerate synthase